MAQLISNTENHALKVGLLSWASSYCLSCHIAGLESGGRCPRGLVSTSSEYHWWLLDHWLRNTVVECNEIHLRTFCMVLGLRIWKEMFALLTSQDMSIWDILANYYRRKKRYRFFFKILSSLACMCEASTEMIKQSCFWSSECTYWML